MVVDGAGGPKFTYCAGSDCAGRQMTVYLLPNLEAVHVDVVLGVAETKYGGW